MDNEQRDSMSETQRRRRLPSVPNCENCHIARDYIAFREQTEERLTAGDLRMASNEAAIARVAGAVDAIPKLIDAKFDSLIMVMKTRDSAAALVRSGRSQDLTPSGKPSELKLPGGISWTTSSGALSRVMSTVLLAIVMGCAVLGGAYVAMRWGPQVARAK